MKGSKNPFSASTVWGIFIYIYIYIYIFGSGPGFQQARGDARSRSNPGKDMANPQEVGNTSKEREHTGRGPTPERERAYNTTDTIGPADHDPTREREIERERAGKPQTAARGQKTDPENKKAANRTTSRGPVTKWSAG